MSSKMDKKTRDYYLSCGIKLSWNDKSLDDFTNDRKVLLRVKDYLSKLDEAKKKGIGLFLWGANGCGKTHLMNCAFKELIEKRQRVHIFSLDEIVDKFTAGWYSDEVKQELTHTLYSADFIGIDEFGKNIDKDGNAKYLPDLVKRVMDSVIRYRVQMKKPIWFTSNTSPSNVKKVFSEDVASLLKEAVIAIQVTGEDYRGIIQKANKDFV